MGKDLCEASLEAREVFDRANKIVGFDLASICFNGPEERLNQTDVSQPAIYVTSIASFVAAKAAGKTANQKWPQFYSACNTRLKGG